MADLFVLSGAAPTLYVFPSQVHPSSPPLDLFGGGPTRNRTPRPNEQLLRRKADEEALIAGLI